MPEAANSVTVVIPARYGSSRFPGKPLVSLAGKPMIQHVYERARTARRVSHVLVATDDLRIADAVAGFGGECVLTRDPFRTGTDRVAAVARELPGRIFVNLQGDEIMLTGELLDDLIEPFLRSGASMGTLKRALNDEGDIRNPAVVKVLTDQTGRALYFSRATIPHIREGATVTPQAGTYFVHLGVYIFTRDVLERFAALPTGALEDLEKLEQLRALEHGIPIQVWETRHHSLRIDTPEDVPQATKQLEQCAPCS